MTENATIPDLGHPAGGVEPKLENETMTRVLLNRRNKKAKTWAKLVTGIDRSAKGGYAIKGDWIDIGSQVDLPEGAVIVIADDDDIAILIVAAGKTTCDKDWVNVRGILENGDYEWHNYKKELPTLLDAIEGEIECWVDATDPRGVAIAQIKLLMAEHEIDVGELA